MKILFVTSTRIGDAVLSTGLLSHLVASHPEARITIACGPDAAPLFEAVPNLERIIAVAKRPFALHWPVLWGRTVASVWDLVVDLRGSALAWLLMARQRRAYRADPTPMRRIERYAGVLGLSPPPAPRIWRKTAHEAAAERLIPPGAPPLALAPVANWPPKTWPAENFAELVRRLTGPGGILAGARIAVFGSTNERDAAAAVLGAVPPERCVDLIGRIDLLTVSACLGRCALYIGNDTGLTHLAAASGVPTLALFGPTNALHYAPWGERTAFVSTAVGYDELVTAPGFDHRCSDNLMGSLGVDAVTEAAEALWRGSPQQAA